MGEDAQRPDLFANLKMIASRMKEALRRDVCAKLCILPEESREKLRNRVTAIHAANISTHVIGRLCSSERTYKDLIADEELATCIDTGAVVEALLEVTSGLRRSFVTLQTAWEVLREWQDFVADTSSNCDDALQLLSHIGMMALPIEVKRRTGEAGESPYTIEVTRVCATPVDTVSLIAALRAEHVIVPPEGGVAIEDCLLLIDPDVPRSSRLALSSTLLKEEYMSLVYHREAGKYGGPNMHLALHAHALFEAIQPPARGVRKEDLEAQMRRQYHGRAYQCASCSFGPIDHFACGDLAHHNGERIGNAVISNACPRCGWFSRYLSAWPKWDGTTPEEALLSCVSSDEEALQITAASAEVALRICYSARHMWDCGPSGEAHKLLKKLADWETLTFDDGIEHMAQLLLALVTTDDVPEKIFGPVPIAQFLNEVCARKANNELHRNGKAIALRRVGAFLGISFFTAPKLIKRLPMEKQRAAALESCRSDFTIDPEAYDFKSWVKGAIAPWANAIMFARRLRGALSSRPGGWRRLQRDLEAGQHAYADVLCELQKPATWLDTPASLLGVRSKNTAQRVLATVASQAFLHAAAKSRRTKDFGGELDEPLGDVCDESTLKGLAIELRMMYFDELLASSDKVRQAIESAGHLHSLPKRQFWELWEQCHGDNVLRFLTRANEAFVDKHGLE